MRRGYRPELDAIRGIAILLVMLDHGILLTGGRTGQIGVTLFFVLSGYLITELLLAEREATGGIDLRGFYERRFRRLTPALVALVAVAVALQWPGNPIPALGYFTNIYVWSVGSQEPMGWLVHTWTLAREEQFYIAWPLLFLLVGSSRRLTIVALLAMLVLALGPLHVVVTAGLVVGCLLAVVKPRLHSLVGVIGWVALGAGLAFPVDPWLIALASVLVVGAPQLTPRGPLVRIGQISYGLYLWSLPMASVMLVAIPGDLLIRVTFTIAATFAIALVSERWVERPFRLTSRRLEVGDYRHDPVRPGPATLGA